MNTVEKSLGIQISYGQGAWKDISPEDQAAARDAISENCCWGVKQTSQRIVAFGKALVGGDPSRVEEMRALISMLDKELSDCKAGLEKG